MRQHGWSFFRGAGGKRAARQRLEYGAADERQRMNIYVGNLPYNTTDDDLKTAFAPFGTVDSASVIKDKFSGQSRGFGFVEMSAKEEGERAIEQLNGQELEGRALVVNEARPREARPPRGGGYHGGDRGGRGGDRGGRGGGRGDRGFDRGDRQYR